MQGSREHIISFFVVFGPLTGEPEINDADLDHHFGVVGILHQMAGVLADQSFFSLDDFPFRFGFRFGMLFGQLIHRALKATGGEHMAWEGKNSQQNNMDKDTDAFHIKRPYGQIQNLKC